MGLLEWSQMKRPFRAGVLCLLVLHLSVPVFSSSDGRSMFLRILVVRNLSLAEQILQELNRGASFADLAREHSIDRSAVDGGYLGSISPTRMNREFQQAAESLEPGAHSSIFRSGYDYALLYRMPAGFQERARGLEEEGDRLREQGEWDRAIETYRKALDLDPNFAEALAKLGSSYARAGKIAEARTAFFQAYRLAPDSSRVLYGFGKFLVSQGQLRTAEGHLRRAADLDPDLTQLAAVEISAGQVEQALKQNPQDPKLLILKSRLSFERGDLELSSAVLDKVDRKHLEISLSLRLAEQLFWLARSEEALSFLNRLDLNPDEKEEAARILIRFKYNDEGERILKSLSSSSAQLKLVNLYGNQSRFLEAKEVLERVTARDPGNWDALYYLGSTLNSLDQFDEASIALLEALRLRPGQEEVFHQLADVNSRSGQMGTALEWLDKGIRLHPDSFLLHLEKGRILMKGKEISGALEHLQKALAQRPDHVETHYLLGRLHHRLKDPATARNYFDRFDVLQKRKPKSSRKPGMRKIDPSLP